MEEKIEMNLEVKSICEADLSPGMVEVDCYDTDGQTVTFLVKEEESGKFHYGQDVLVTIKIG